MKRSRSRSPDESIGWKKLTTERKGGSVRLYITNLPYEIRWQELKDLFKEKFGNDVSYAQLYDDFNGKPSGCGVVEMKSKESALRAIDELDRFEMRGRKIIVREEREKDRNRHNLESKRDEKDRSGHKNYHSPVVVSSHHKSFNVELMNELGVDIGEITNQVFVANLDYKVTKQKLEEVFRMAGNVIEAEIKHDKDGRSRGMGIVRFEHPIEAVQAISLFTGQFLYDRQMYVRMDRWVEPLMQQIHSRLPVGLKGIGIGLGSSGKPLLNIGEIANTLTLSMLMGQGNSQQQSSSLLQSQMQEVKNFQMPVNNLNNSFNFNNQPCLPFNSNLVNSILSANRSLQTPVNPILPSLFPSTLNNRALSSSFSKPSDPFTNFPVQKIESSDEQASIFVKNLPYSFATKDLYERFREFGEIKFAEVKVDHVGNSKGCAVVQYFDQEAAKRAISFMNGGRLDGRIIEVRLDKL